MCTNANDDLKILLRRDQLNLLFYRPNPVFARKSIKDTHYQKFPSPFLDFTEREHSIFQMDPNTKEIGKMENALL